MTTWVGDGGGQNLYVFIRFLTTTIAEHYLFISILGGGGGYNSVPQSFGVTHHSERN